MSSKCRGGRLAQTRSKSTGAACTLLDADVAEEAQMLKPVLCLAELKVHKQAMKSIVDNFKDKGFTNACKYEKEVDGKKLVEYIEDRIRAGGKRGKQFIDQL